MDQPLDTGTSSTSDHGAGSSAKPCLLDPLQQALAITAEIFPGPFVVQDEFNPENPADKWQTIVVQAKGEVSEIVDNTGRWHRRMIEALGPAGMDITIRAIPNEV